MVVLTYMDCCPPICAVWFHDVKSCKRWAPTKRFFGYIWNMTLFALFQTTFPAIIWHSFVIITLYWTTLNSILYILWWALMCYEPLVVRRTSYILYLACNSKATGVATDIFPHGYFLCFCHAPSLFGYFSPLKHFFFFLCSPRLVSGASRVFHPPSSAFERQQEERKTATASPG